MGNVSHLHLHWTELFIRDTEMNVVSVFSSHIRQSDWQGTLSRCQRNPVTLRNPESGAGWPWSVAVLWEDLLRWHWPIKTGNRRERVVRDKTSTTQVSSEHLPDPGWSISCCIHVLETPDSANGLILLFNHCIVTRVLFFSLQWTVSPSALRLTQN